MLFYVNYIFLYEYEENLFNFQYSCWNKYMEGDRSATSTQLLATLTSQHSNTYRHHTTPRHHMQAPMIITQRQPVDTPKTKNIQAQYRISIFHKFYTFFQFTFSSHE